MRDKSGDVNILIVEDSPTQAEALSYTLTQRGYNVSIAPNGRKALNAIRKQRPTLVISDIVMPEMDGFDLCREIKKNLKDIPVILLTALCDPADVLKGLECGADNFITKPYDENYLLARIHHILINAKLRSESKMQMGVELFFRGSKYFITSERQQILDLLLSTYETAVMKNMELKEVQEELEAVNGRLENMVQERTRALLAEMEERKKAEEQVRRLNVELEQRIRERTAQLEEANEDLKSFSYSISHDLKSPLRWISGFSQILLQKHGEELNEESKALVDKIIGSTETMQMLINGILKFSRAGQTEITLTDIDTNNMVKGIVEELAAGAGGRDIRFKIDALLPAVSDALVVRQIFYNLLSNAVKFTRGKEHAEIEVGGSEKEGEKIYYVKDNGAGFDPRYAEKLFCVFQRLHSTNEFEGTGIGLAIVKRFINKLSGRVWAEGAVGQGATFYFTLPKAKEI
jgi:signal transduction histidine kinase